MFGFFFVVPKSKSSALFENCENYSFGPLQKVSSDYVDI